MVAAASGDGCEIVEVATIAWWQLGFLLLGCFDFFFFVMDSMRMNTGCHETTLIPINPAG